MFGSFRLKSVNIMRVALPCSISNGFNQFEAASPGRLRGAKAAGGQKGVGQRRMASKILPAGKEFLEVLPVIDVPPSGQGVARNPPQAHLGHGLSEYRGRAPVDAAEIVR